MPLNIRNIIEESFLELLEDKPLNKITINDLLEKSEVSRQTFYNHFKDKNDLIEHIYLDKIIPDFNKDDHNIKFYDSLLVSLYNMRTYQSFMVQACKEEGQNNLKEYISTHCQQFDLKWHQELYGNKEMSEALKMATIYHSLASSAMTFSWILSGMKIEPEEIAQLINNLRSVGMDELFKDGDHPNPYK